MTCFVDHIERFSHDAVKRYLEGDKTSTRMVWSDDEQVHDKLAHIKAFPKGHR